MRLARLFFAMFLVFAGIAAMVVANGDDETTPPTAAQEEAPPQTQPQTARVAAQLQTDFSEESAIEFVPRQYAEGALPAVVDGELVLLSGVAGEKNAVGFARVVEGPTLRWEASFTADLTEGARGFSVAWLNTARFGASGPAFEILRAHNVAGAPTVPNWDEPNLWASFAIGFDTHNPPPEDLVARDGRDFGPNPFNEWGNVYDHPQREVSLHWDGREIANAFCPAPFVTGEPVPFDLAIEFVTGGAEVTVRVGEAVVYDRQFVPFMQPYESRLAMGALAGDGEARLAVDNLSAAWLAPVTEPAPVPVTLHLMEDVWLRPGGRGSADRVCDLLPEEFGAERLLLTYTFQPMMDRDEWDRCAAVYVWDDAGQRIEIARVITPFMMWDEAYPFVVDVTPYRHLLAGRRRIGVMAGANVNQGFVVDLDLTVYRALPGLPALPQVVVVENLWSGEARFNPNNGPAAFFAPRSVEVPADATGAWVRMMVTGHGTMEFTPISRTLTVNDRAFENRLWTTDCYLNPFRPQFGTWKYERAGWGSGSVVRPWLVDVSDLLVPGEPLRIQYESAPFETGGWATHWVEAQVMFTR